ncbi:hypothetical protein D3C87_1418120 [compost metagenome]
MRLGQIEEDKGLGAPAAVLRAAEGNEIDAALPGHLGRCRFKAGERIGKACAVHVQRQLVSLGDRGDRFDLIERIDGAAFGRLRQRHRHRLAAMDIVERVAANFRFQPGRVHLAVLAVDGLQSCAMGEEFRRTALVGGHMGFAVAEGDAAGAAGAGKRQRIGGRPRADEEDGDIVLEDLRQFLLHLPVELAGAVGGCVAVGMGHEALGDGRVGTGPVVRGKNHHISSCFTVVSMSFGRP